MATATSVLDQKLSNKTPGKLGIAIFGAVLLVGVVYAGISLGTDLSSVHPGSVLPFVLLGVALMVALGFEFVNGFHDTANAVATVIYTHSLEPHMAVVWSGFWNFLGVLTSSGLVAFAIVSLLPVELILQVGSKAGFAMVFALLIAAIIWNLGTWYFGLPASSSHTLIGSVIGVGIANQLMAGPARAAWTGGRRSRLESHCCFPRSSVLPWPLCCSWLQKPCSRTRSCTKRPRAMPLLPSIFEPCWSSLAPA
jgi:PiT family inorganic phosphate transporter